MSDGAGPGRETTRDEDSPADRVEVAAAVIARADRYLIAQRRRDQRFPLRWEFPGGKREIGESWEACLARELREELGIAVRIGGLVDAVTHAYADQVVSLRFFRCALLEGEPRPLGCRDVLWARAGDLPRFRFLAADAALVAWLARGEGAGRGARRDRRPRAALARVAFASEARSVQVPIGTALDEAAARAGVGPAIGCRFGLCGQCALSVRDGRARLSRPTRAERATLRAIGAPAGSRLACVARIRGELVVERLGADRALA